MSQAKLVFAGDFCPQYNKDELEQIIKDGIFDEKITQFLLDRDFSTINLEAPFDFGKHQKIQKIGPHLITPINSLQILKALQFSHVCLANNHILDYGEDAIKLTCEKLSKDGFQIVGVGQGLKKARESNNFILNNIKFSIINVTENEFSVTTDDQTWGANPFNLVDIAEQIKEEKTKNDIVIIYYHGGNEYHELPSPYHQKNSRFLINMGASIIIFNHSHSISGYEKYNNGLIFYGLGNFLFNWPSKRNMLWYYGILLKCIVDDSLNISFEIQPYCQFLNNNKIATDNSIENVVLTKIQELNDIIQNEERLLQRWYSFIEQRKPDILVRLESATRISLLYNKIKQKLGFSTAINYTRKLYIRNLITCESHYYVLRDILKK